MGKLWLYGDSFAEGCCDNIKSGYIEKTASHFISELLDLDVQNFAMGGCSSLDIAGQVLNSITKISKEDYVVIHQTGKFRWAYPSYITKDAFREKDNYIFDYLTPSKNEDWYKYIKHTNVKMARDIETMFGNNNLFVPLNDEEKNLTRDFYLGVFLKYSDFYNNYYNNFYKSAINSVNSICDNVVIVDNDLWFDVLDPIVRDFYEDRVEVYCSCHHWSQETHFVLSKIIQKCFELKENHLSKENIHKIYELTK